LLPKAGPTGGEGDACPAPTMSLTMTSFCIALFAMLPNGVCGSGREMLDFTEYVFFELLGGDWGRGQILGTSISALQESCSPRKRQTIKFYCYVARSWKGGPIFKCNIIAELFIYKSEFDDQRHHSYTSMSLELFSFKFPSSNNFIFVLRIASFY
jgi:hypothetical protein